MSRRTVDLDPRTIAVLKAWKRDQIAERVALGVRPRDDSLVFAKPDGTPIHPDSYSQYFDRLVAASDVPRIRPHDLRHTHATILQMSDVAEDASFGMVRDRGGIRGLGSSLLAAAG